MDQPIEIRVFSREVDRTNFSCGIPEMDDWLQLYAGQSERKGETRTYFAMSGTRLVGFVSLCAISLQMQQSSSRPNHTISGVLIARLAVTTALQNSGVGRELLRAAFRIAAETAERIGVKLVASSH
jgi:predicted N-acetyltransferase YhbS